MKKITILLLLLLLSNSTFSQNYPQIKVKPIKEKGKAKIYYKLKDKFVYFPNTELIDWKNSLEKLEVSEKFNPNYSYYVETCKLSDGKKNGKFSISELLLMRSSTSNGSIFYYTTKGDEIISGNYLNNDYNGEIYFYTYLKNQKCFVKLEYEIGKVKDQLLKYPIVDKSGLSYKKYLFYPSILFENGVVKETVLDEGGVLKYKKFEGKKCSIMSYETDVDILKNKYIYYLATGLHSYSTVWDDFSNKYIFNGSYRVFEANDKIFDTTSNLKASLNYIDGNLSDLQKIYINPQIQFHIEFNCVNSLIEGQLHGYINGKINYIEEFLNGKLHGISKSFFEDGKIAVEANYVDGHLSGFVKSYYNSDSKYNNFLYNEKINYNDINVKLNESEYRPNIYGISSTNQDFRDNIVKKIISDGGNINPTDLVGYFLCESSNFEYNNLKKTSELNNISYLYSSGKIMVKINGGVNPEIIWYDSSGKKIGGFSQKQKIDAEEKEKEKLNNTMVNCKFCNKKIKYGDAYITGGECHCFKNVNGEKQSSLLGGLFIVETAFCSRKCNSDFEKDCCRRNGYSYE